MSRKFYTKSEVVLVPHPTYRTFKDLTGASFNNWTVLGYAGKDTHGIHKWYCLCLCGSGKIVKVSTFHLTNGNSKSCGCTRKTTRSDNFKHLSRFIEKSKSVYGDLYDYTNVKYVDSHTKVEIVCREHGSFYQSPTGHLRGGGCAHCSYSARKVSKEDFIDKCRAIHGDKYDYSFVNYDKLKDKVIIVCPLHGEFEQRADTHANGSGCIRCAYDSLQGCLNYTTIERSRDYFLEEPNNLYILSMNSLGDNVHKIGISKDVDKRVNCLKPHCSEISIVHKYETSTYMAFHLEQIIHHILKNDRFISGEVFGGHTELYVLDEYDINFLMNGLTND